jgi:hypothetical protein
MRQKPEADVARCEDDMIVRGHHSDSAVRLGLSRGAAVAGGGVHIAIEKG